jgi:hypothetical protein
MASVVECLTSKHKALISKIPGLPLAKKCVIMTLACWSPTRGFWRIWNKACSLSCGLQYSSACPSCLHLQPHRPPSPQLTPQPSSEEVACLSFLFLRFPSVGHLKVWHFYFLLPRELFPRSPGHKTYFWLKGHQFGRPGLMF